MPYLAAAVIVVGALCLFNIAVTFAIVRRLAGLTARPGRPAGTHEPPPLLPVGSQAPDFAVTTTSGETRSLDDLAGSRSLLGFFSPGCPPCEKAIPEFIEYAHTISGGAPQVLAVVSGAAGPVTEGFARDLREVASVVIEPLQGSAAAAFGVTGYPRFYVLDERGQVEASGRSMRLLLAAGPA